MNRKRKRCVLIAGLIVLSVLLIFPIMNAIAGGSFLKGIVEIPENLTPMGAIKVYDHVTATSTSTSSSDFGELFTWKVKNTLAYNTHVKVYASNNRQGVYSPVGDFNLIKGASKTITYNVSKGKYIKVETKQEDGSYASKKFEIAKQHIVLARAQVLSRSSEASIFGKKFTWRIKNATSKDTFIRVYTSKSVGGTYSKVSEFKLVHGASRQITYNVDRGKFIMVETRQGDGKYISDTYLVDPANITLPHVQTTSQASSSNDFGEKYSWRIKNATSKDTYVNLYASTSAGGHYTKVAEFDLNHGASRTVAYAVTKGKYIKVETRQGDGNFVDRKDQANDESILLNPVQCSSVSSEANIFGEKFTWRFKNNNSKDTYIRVYTSTSAGGYYNKVSQFNLGHGASKTLTYNVTRGKYIKVETRQGDGSYTDEKYSVAQAYITLPDAQAQSLSAEASIFGENFQWNVKNTTSKDTHIRFYVSESEGGNYTKVLEFDLGHGQSKVIDYAVGKGKFIKVETRQGDGDYHGVKCEVAQEHIPLPNAEVTSIRSHINDFGVKYTWELKNTTSKDTRVRVYASTSQGGTYTKTHEFDLGHGASNTITYAIANGKYIKVETRQGDGTYYAEKYVVDPSNITYDAVEVTPIEVTGSDTIEWKIKNTGDRHTHVIVTAKDKQSHELDSFNLNKEQSHNTAASLVNAQKIGVKVRQGDGTYAFNQYEATLADTHVDIQPLSGHAWIYRNGNLVDEADVVNSHTFKTLEGTIDIKIEVNGQVCWYHGINGTGEVTLDKADATVNYLGVERVNNVKIISANGQVHKQSWTDHQATFQDLPNGIYTIEVQKGSMVYRKEDVVLIGGVIHDVPLTHLTVNYPGVKRVNTASISVGSAAVVQSNWTNDGTTFILFRGQSYNLKMKKGGMIHEATILCNKENVTYDVPLTRLQVNFLGVKRVNNVYIKVGAEEVMQENWADDGTHFILFRGTNYNLKLKKGGMIHEASVLCDQENTTYDVPLTNLQINFPGVERVNNVYVKVSDEAVMQKSWSDNNASLILFRGSNYNLKLQKGGMIHEGTILCDEDNEAYDVPLTVLTINYPNVKRVNNVYVKVGDADVMQRSWTNDSTTFTLFRDMDYNLKLQKDVMGHEGAIRCNDPTETYNVPICHVTTRFDGFQSRVAAIGMAGNDVSTVYWARDKAEFYVFQNNPYYVRMEINGQEYRYDPVDCRADEVILDDSELHVQFPNVYASVKVLRQDGSVAKNFGGRWNEAKGDVPNGCYDIVISQGSSSVRIEDVRVIGSSTLISDLVCAVTVNYPNVYANIKIENSTGRITQTGGQWNKAVLYVLRSLEYRDLTITQGASSVVLENQVYNTDAVTINDRVCEVTVNYPSIYANVEIDNTVGRITQAGGQWDQAKLYVLRSDEPRDITVTQGATSVTRSGEIFNTNAVTLNDFVCEVTVNYPNVYADVKIDNGAGRITQTGGQWNQAKLYVLLSDELRKVALTQGSTSVARVDQVFNTNAITLDDWVGEVTVNYPGVYGNVKINNGAGRITQTGSQWNQAKLYVLKSGENRLVEVTQGATNISKAIVLDSDTVIDNLVCNISVDFNGVYASADMSNSSGRITNTGGTWHGVVLRVLRSNETRTITLKQGSEVKSVGGLVYNGLTGTLNNQVCQLTVNFSGEYASTKVTNGTGTVASAGGRWDQAVINLLRKENVGDKYTVTVTIGGVEHKLDVSGVDFSQPTAVVTYVPTTTP